MTASRGLTQQEWQAKRAVQAQQNELIKQLANHWSEQPGMTRARIISILEGRISKLGQQLNMLGQLTDRNAAKQIVFMKYMMAKFNFTEADVEEWRKGESAKIKADLLLKPFPNYVCKNDHITALEGKTFGDMLGQKLKCGTCDEIVDCLPRQLIYPEEATSIETPPPVPGNGTVSAPVDLPAEAPTSIVLTD